MKRSIYDISFSTINSIRDKLIIMALKSYPSRKVFKNDPTKRHNKRNVRFHTNNGLSLTLVEWAKKLRVKRSMLAQRFYVYGWSGERLFNGLGD